MAERAATSQVTQLGVETVSGTCVPAAKKLASIGFGLTPTLETRTIKPAGAKYPTQVVVGRDWTSLAVGGDAAYDDLGFICCSALCVPTKTGAGPYSHSFIPKISASDVVNTFTIERGEPNPLLNDQVCGVQMNEMSLAFSREAVEVSGSAIGKAIVFNTTQTASPVALPLLPLLPNNVCVYVDPTSVALGTTKQLRVLSASWGIAGRYNPLFVLDCAQASYVALVEAEPEITITLNVEADTQGNALLSTYGRPGAIAYIRIECIKDAQHGLTIDTAAVVTGIGERGDQDGVYAYEVTFTGVAVPSWGVGQTTKWTIGCDTALV
jgi:hypothetical protein